LRFSSGHAVEHTLIGALFAAAFFFFAWQFGRHDTGLPLTTYSRSRWFYDLGNTANGWTGILVCSAVGALCGWLTVRAVWRFFTIAPAATWDGYLVRFHATYGSHLAIPSAQFEAIKLYREVPPRLFGLTPPIDTLRFTLREGRGPFRRRQIKLRSNTIEGGLNALEAFERTLDRSLAS
jgi:hypothetical protein